MEINYNNFEIKSHQPDGSFTAYGSTFGNEDFGGDVVVKGAFTKSLVSNPAERVYMFYNHDSKEIIGEYTSIVEDEHGLLIKGQLFIDEIQRAKETYALMKKGWIKKFSIGYNVVKKSYESGKRMLEELKLIEVSPVTFPMNAEANLLMVKHKVNHTKRDVEKLLRDVGGFSQKEAKSFIAEGWKGLDCDDSDTTKEKQQTSDIWTALLNCNKENSHE